MCGSMVDIQSPTAEIRRGNKKERKKERNRMKIHMVCLLHRATINKRNTANSLPLYIVKTDACVKCTYTVRECLLLPRDAAMLARSWDS